MRQFTWGALFMASFVAGLFFLKFWRATGDRLFAFFCLAFWVFALNWASLAAAVPGEEAHLIAYAIRLLGFILILVGILDKNLQR